MKPQSTEQTPMRPAGRAAPDGRGAAFPASHYRLRAAAARLIIGLLLVGVPILLIGMFGNPLPTTAQLLAILRFEPDWDDQILLGNLLPCATWIVWATFAYPLVIELVLARLGRAAGPGTGWLRGQRQLAAGLVAAALLTSSPAVAATGSPVTSTVSADVIGGTSSGLDLTSGASLTAGSAVNGSRPKRDEQPQSTEHAYRVKRGDTLWSIADRELGSATDYPDIVDASAATVQPDGRRLTDPDLIITGWRLTIPSEKHPSPTKRSDPERPRLQPTPRPATSVPTAPSSAVSTAPARTPSIPAHDVATPAPSSAPGALDVAPVVTTGGIASMLAACLLAALAIRRRRQRAARPRGERIGLPAEGRVADFEEHLRAASDPEGLQRVHRALHDVFGITRQAGRALPQLFAVRLDASDIALYLLEPADLAEPFTPLFSDGTAWIAPRDAFSAPADAHAIAAYPALVTIGTDLDGGILLLDLEQQRRLRIRGDQPLQTGMLNAITAELAAVPWGEDLHLSLVGLPAALATQLDPYRLHRVADVQALAHDIRVHLDDRRAALMAQDLPDVRTARTSASTPEAWAPFVVLIGAAMTQADQAVLDELLEKYASAGLVVVETAPPGDSAPAIVLGRPNATFLSADIALPSLPFKAQVLDDEALEDALALFALASPASPRQEDADAQPVGSAAPTSSPPATEADGDRDAVRQGAHSLTVETHAPVSAEAVDDGGSRSSIAGVQLEPPHAPWIRILGQVEVLHLERPELMPGRGAELLTFLLHHPQPVSGAQIQKALWPNTYDRSNNNARTLAKQVRAALGHDADGHLWLPEGRGGTGFTLHPDLSSDWREFERLVGPQADAASSNRLAAALRLVRDQPLLGTDAHRGRWPWRARLEEEIIATVQDVAEILSERALDDDQTALVRLAARAARLADPLGEVSWRIELRAAVRRGSAVEVERIVDELYAVAGNGDDAFEPDPETAALIAAARSSERHS